MCELKCTNKYILKKPWYFGLVMSYSCVSLEILQFKKVVYVVQCVGDLRSFFLMMYNLEEDKVIAIFCPPYF